MENRLIRKKIFISKEGVVLEKREKSETNLVRRNSPTEREKLTFLDSF